jgi:hypothetical protein
MSGTSLDQLRIRERELELEAIAVRARYEEVRSLIRLIEQQMPKRGRPRDSDNVNVSVVNRPGLPWEDAETAA